MIVKYTLKNNIKGAIMKGSDKLFLRKSPIIETIIQVLKIITQVEHLRHRSFDNFIINTLRALTAYDRFLKKPTINIERTVDRQLTVF